MPFEPIGNGMNYCVTGERRMFGICEMYIREWRKYTIVQRTSNRLVMVVANLLCYKGMSLHLSFNVAVFNFNVSDAASNLPTRFVEMNHPSCLIGTRV